LKKSWHPSTMKNMEKVRKAEQQNVQENKRIAELKKEIEMEKDLEDIKKYAIEQGVIEKKDDKKLDWMYKGPNQAINREEYLLGRPVDKAFEQMQQAEKDVELNRMPKNHVEYGKYTLNLLTIMSLKVIKLKSRNIRIHLCFYNLLDRTLYDNKRTFLTIFES